MSGDDARARIYLSAAIPMLHGERIFTQAGNLGYGAAWHDRDFSGPGSTTGIKLEV